mgnify:CR=1 FL=1
MTHEEIFIPPDHPRAESLRIRERLIEGYRKGVVATAGLIAHGRGEAFDYILGEKTHAFAIKAMRAAIALFLLARNPVFSVNGNVAALVAREYVELAKLVGAKIEVNLFYRTRDRELAIKKALLDAGAEEILGVDEEYQTTIPEISHMRRIVDKRGIYIADVVFVPLEDGDRTMALRKLGKKVVTIDLNPMSRTAQWANVTIVDNIVRALPKMIKIAKDMKKMEESHLKEVISQYRNERILSEALETMLDRLRILAQKGIFIGEA